MMITLDEMDTRISEMFLSSQLDYIGWNSLSDGDKLIALKNAHITLNKLQWAGYKVDPNQEDAFPRMMFGIVVETPEDVKRAICQYCFDYIRIMNNPDLCEIHNQGITSRQVHNIKETYDLSRISVGNTEFKKYLSDWIYRGVR